MLMQGKKGLIMGVENDKSIGKRMILAENTYWMKEICTMINKHGHKAPTYTPPVFLVKFMANFDKTIRPVKPLLGVDVSFNTDLAKSILDYNPIPIEKTIKDTSDFLKSYKLFAHFEDKLIEFKQIEAETLVCTAKGDVGSTPDMTNQLGEIISNSKVIIFDQGKHMVGIECAEEVNGVFSNFIEGKL